MVFDKTMGWAIGFNISILGCMAYLALFTAKPNEQVWSTFQILWWLSFGFLCGRAS